MAPSLAGATPARPSTVAVRASVTLDAWGVLSDQVGRGVAYGLRRHNKHAAPGDALTERQQAMLEEALPDHIMTALSDVLKFPD